MQKTILGDESLEMVKRYLKIAQAALQKAHQDARPVMSWLLQPSAASPSKHGGHRPAFSALHNCRAGPTSGNLQACRIPDYGGRFLGQSPHLCTPVPASLARSAKTWAVCGFVGT